MVTAGGDMRRVLTVGLAGLAMCVAAVSAAGGAGAAAAVSSGTAIPGGGQNIRAPGHPGIAKRNTGSDTQSLNWAGYAQQAAGRGTFTGVTATFVVTTVDTAVPGQQYSADWVGIGGFASNKLVQAGIEEDNIDGTAFYQAWTEILPHAEVPLSLAIAPGNKITVTVRQTANKKNKNKRWSMTVTDDTTGLSGGRTVRYTSFEDSAEVIHERPCIGSPCSSNLATLATTSNETYEPAYYTSSAPNVAAVYHPLLASLGSVATLYDIAMLGNDGSTVIAIPSDANTAADGFTVADGSTVPAAPSP